MDQNLVESVMGEMRRMMRAEFKHFHERLDRIEEMKFGRIIEVRNRETRMHKWKDKKIEGQKNKKESFATKHEEFRPIREIQLKESGGSSKSSGFEEKIKLAEIEKISHDKLLKVKIEKADIDDEINHIRPEDQQLEDETKAKPPLENVCEEEYVAKGELVVVVQANEDDDKYEYEMVHDDVLVHDGPLLLGRPWKIDGHVNIDGFTNKYSFVINQKLITLVPVMPNQVFEDPMKLQTDSDQMKKSAKEKILNIYYSRVSEIKRVLFSIASYLQDYGNVFPKKKMRPKSCKLVFDPGSLVLLHMRKGRFTPQICSTLLPRGYGPIQLLEWINEKTYKLQVLCCDLRTNPFQEEENDRDQGAQLNDGSKDTIHAQI